MSSWYIEVSSEEKISQGDIFLNLPIALAQPYINTEDPYDIKKSDILVDNLDVVVMTQACDLETHGVKNVILAPLLDPKTMELGEGTNRWQFITEVHAGRRANYSLIGKHESVVEKKTEEELIKLEISYKIVDFSQLFPMPFDFLDHFKLHHGKRLRLNVPHREQLSQYLGNYFGRIGLPNEDFIDKKILRADLKL